MISETLCLQDSHSALTHAEQDNLKGDTSPRSQKYSSRDSQVLEKHKTGQAMQSQAPSLVMTIAQYYL